MKTVSKLILAGASAALAFAPVAAQAGTRASDSGANYSAPASQPGSTSVGASESLVGDNSFLIGFLVGLWASGIIVIIADLDDDENQSPGGN